MMNYNIVLVSILLLCSCVKAFVTNCPAGGGTYTCPANTPNYMMTASSLTLTNCAFISCPSIVIQTAGASLFLSGTTFTYTNNAQGAIFANNSGISVIISGNSGFYNGTSTSNNALVTSNFPGFTFNATNLMVRYLSGNTNGWLLYVVGGSSNVNLMNSQFFNYPNSDGKSLIRVQGTSMNIWNCEFGYGGKTLIFEQTPCTVNVYNSYFHDLSTVNDEGMALAVNARSVANVYNTRFVNCVSTNYNGGAIKTSDGTVVSVTGCTFSRCRSKQGGAMCCQDQNSAFYVTSCLFDSNYATSDGGAIYTFGYSTTTIMHTIFSNNGGSAGGALSANFATVYPLILNCTFIANNSPNEGITQMNSIATGLMQDCTFIGNIGSAALAVKSFGCVMNITGNNVFRDNYLTTTNKDMAAGIRVDDTGVLNVFGTLTLINNTGNVAGAIIVKGTGNLNIYAQDLIIRGNRAFSVPTNNAAGFRVDTGAGNAIVIMPGTPSTYPNVMDGLYSNNAAGTQDLVIRNYGSRFPNIVFRSAATSLVMTMNGYTLSSNPIQLLLSQAIPDFVIVAVDAFGNEMAVDQTNPIVVAIKETCVTNSIAPVTYVGEAIKAILNPTTNRVTFSNVLVRNPIPNQVYCFSVVPLGNIVKGLNALLPFPTFNVTFQNCDSVSQRLVPAENKCYPALRLSNGLRVVLSLLNIFVVIAGVVGAALVLFYRDYQLMKANSWIFLTIISLGCSLNSLAQGLQVSSQFFYDLGSGAGCLASPWLDNLGFALIFTALILKTRRIQQIFLRTPSTSAVMKDREMLLVLGATILVVIAYLISWTVVSPSVKNETYFFGQYVFLDYCAQSSFSTIAIVLHLFIQLISAYLAFSIRKVPSDFNESQQIALVTYNWIIFGAIFLVIKGYAVTDPSVSYAIGSVSAIITNASTLGILIFHKIYTCYFYPEKAKKAGTTSSLANQGKKNPDKGSSAQSSVPASKQAQSLSNSNHQITANSRAI